MKRTTERKTILCESLTKPLPTFSHAVVYDGIVYVSCIQGFIPGTFEFPSVDPEEQARQVLRNLRVALHEAGSSMGNVLKITIFMINAADFPQINDAIDEAFPESPPARTSIIVAQLPKGAEVIIEAIAALDEE